MLKPRSRDKIATRKERIICAPKQNQNNTTSTTMIKTTITATRKDLNCKESNEEDLTNETNPKNDNNTTLMKKHSQENEEVILKKAKIKAQGNSLLKDHKKVCHKKMRKEIRGLLNRVRRVMKTKKIWYRS